MNTYPIGPSQNLSQAGQKPFWDDVDKAHKKNIENLVREYGARLAETEIKRIYGEVREGLEKTAKVDKFLPIMALRMAGEKISEKIVKKAK